MNSGIVSNGGISFNVQQAQTNLATFSVMDPDELGVKKGGREKG